MTPPQPIRWLHLSDLHLGCRGEALWWQVHEEFERSVRERAAELGMPDLILFTGDIAFKGADTEYQQADEFFAALRHWLREATGSAHEPPIVPVPGNHDLTRPTGSDLRRLRFLKSYPKGRDDPDIAAFQYDLWKHNNADEISPLFANYQAWLGRSILPRFQRPELDLHLSHFPGDLSLVYRAEGKVPLLLVGLNSAWMQFQEGDRQGRLELPLEQFQAALGPHGLQRFKAAEQALLLMHHPLDWLRSEAQDAFQQAIYTPSRFAACLHGHMHQGRSESTSISGGQPRHWFQAPSLFGLECYGRSRGSTRETRSMGYAWGELDHRGQLRVWPLARMQSGGEMQFVQDQHLSGYTCVIRPARGATEPAPAQPPSLDLRSWLEETLAHTGHIDIQGIGSGAGRVAGASRYPIERLYTQLRCRPLDRELLRGSEDQGLETLLPRHRLLLIEGQPGAGKTTFLRFAAALLARDGLGRETPAGGTWRAPYLGMDPGQAAPIPVFLRLALLAEMLGEPDPQRPDRRQRLPELMLPEAPEAERQAWLQSLEQGRAPLLLDGMNEVTDPERRQRLLELLRDLVSHWKQAPVVLTSRPIDTRPLREMGFAQTEIAPIARPQVEAFIGHWVGALCRSWPSVMSVCLKPLWPSSIRRAPPKYPSRPASPPPRPWARAAIRDSPGPWPT